MNALIVISICWSGCAMYVTRMPSISCFGWDIEPLAPRVR